MHFLSCGSYTTVACRRDAYIRCLRYIPKATKLKALQSWAEVADSKVSRW